MPRTPINAETTLEALSGYARSELSRLRTGEIFRLQDLFAGYEWNRLPVGVRTSLGRAFFAFAQSDGVTSLVILNKTPQNQQRYRKI